MQAAPSPDRYTTAMAEWREKTAGVARVGMTWGGIGGVIGFVISLLGPLAGLIAAGFVGASCGRRCPRASGEETASGGALAGLLGGLIAAPVFAVGAAAGSVAAARRIGTETIALTLEDVVGTSVSPDEAWRLYLLSLVFAAIVQIALLVTFAATSGALAARKA
ncbi:hypothetical protein [Rubrobacter marinus]|uniref:hypothetical protein n=1 Tax=Rubrobacter marinus TaxID=2653852 RepID=UPI00140B58BA|nr:hypothetical protein [Rubrobacter marinus]